MICYIMRMNDDDWNKVLEVNLKGAFNGIKSVIRTMMKARSGRIINISSVAVLVLMMIFVGLH